MNSFLLNPLLINNNKFSIEKFENSYTSTWFPIDNPKSTTNNNIINGLYCSSNPEKPNKNYIFNNDNPIIKNNYGINNNIIEVGSVNDKYFYKNIYQGFIKFNSDGNYRFSLILNFLSIQLKIIFNNEIIFDTLESNYIDPYNVSHNFNCYISNIKANIYYPILFATKYNDNTYNAVYPSVQLYVSNTKNIKNYIPLNTLFYIPDNYLNYNQTFIDNINVPPIISTSNTIVLNELYKYNFIYYDTIVPGNSKKFSLILLNDNDADIFISSRKKTNAIVFDNITKKQVIGYYDKNNIPSYFDNFGNYYKNLNLNDIDFDNYYFDYNYINSNRDILNSGYNTAFNNKNFKITNIYYGEKKNIVPFIIPQPQSGIYILSNLTKKSNFIYSFTNTGFNSDYNIAYTNVFRIPYKSRLLSIIATAGCHNDQTIKITMTGFEYFLKEIYYNISKYTLDVDLVDLNIIIEANTDIQIKYTTLNYNKPTFGLPGNNGINLGIIMYFEIVP